MPTGRVSWFGGPHDSGDSGHTASGGTTATPGIAIYNRSTLGGYWRVRFPNGRTLTLRQTDIGPHPSTGRKVDVTYSALARAGYSEHNFPTDANVQYSYLGKNPPKGGTTQSSGGQAGTPGTTRITKTVTPGVDNSGLRQQLKFQYLSQAPASPFSAKSLAPGKLPDLSKAAAVPSLTTPQNTAPDPVKYLGQANARSNSLLDLAGQLSQAQDVAPVTKTVTQRTPGRAPQGGSGGSSGPYWAFPVHGHYTENRTDRGVDLETTPGSPLVAVGNGTIVNTQGHFPGGSIVLKLDHPINGYRYVFYGHLNDSNKKVRPGQRVRTGQHIANSSHNPAGAGDMPGHVEIGLALDAAGNIEGAHDNTHNTHSGNTFHQFLYGNFPGKVQRRPIIG